MEVEVSGEKSEIMGLSGRDTLFIWLLGNDFISVPRFTVECNHSNWIIILMGYV